MFSLLTAKLVNLIVPWIASRKIHDVLNCLEVARKYEPTVNLHGISGLEIGP
jgi:hypothetical protein